MGFYFDLLSHANAFTTFDTQIIFFFLRFFVKHERLQYVVRFVFYSIRICTKYLKLENQVKNTTHRKVDWPLPTYRGIDFLCSQLSHNWMIKIKNIRTSGIVHSVIFMWLHICVYAFGFGSDCACKPFILTSPSAQAKLWRNNIKSFECDCICVRRECERE